MSLFSSRKRPDSSDPVWQAAAMFRWQFGSWIQGERHVPVTEVRLLADYFSTTGAALTGRGVERFEQRWPTPDYVKALSLPCEPIGVMIEQFERDNRLRGRWYSSHEGLHVYWWRWDWCHTRNATWCESCRVWIGEPGRYGGTKILLNADGSPR